MSALFNEDNEFLGMVPDPPQAPAEQAQSRRRRHPPIYWGIGLACAVVLLLLVAFVVIKTQEAAALLPENSLLSNFAPSATVATKSATATATLKAPVTATLQATAVATATATVQPTATKPVATATVQPTATKPVATATATLSPTVSSAIDWTLPDPSDPTMLPTELSKALLYSTPPENCATDNDPDVSCSTIKGQRTEGSFTLKAGYAIVMTGDQISLFDGDEILVSRPTGSVDYHDLWVVVNTTNADLTLRMTAPNGSFRGYFVSGEGWTIEEVSHLRDLHLYLFLLPEQNYTRFTPTPVPNCESSEGCDNVDVRVIVFDDKGLHVVSYGRYQEIAPFWTDRSDDLLY
jgi:hypothetical protein